MRSLQGAAFGLSFFIVLLTFSAVAVPAESPVTPLWNKSFETESNLKSAALTFEKNHLHSHYVGMESKTPLRAGKIGEFFIATALMKQMLEEGISGEDPANFYLNDLQLLQPFGDIQLQHLLSRKTGLPLRQTHLYLSDGNRIPSLRDFIIQELKPSILPPGKTITHQSVGDLIPAQVLTEIVTQSRNREVPLTEIVSGTFAPLGFKNTELFKGKTSKQYQASMSGSAAPFSDFPAAWSASPAVHGYLTSPHDLGLLLRALVLGKKPFVPQIQNQIFSEPSMGMLKSNVNGIDYFYLDSQWFGQQLRIAVFPEHQAGFALYYNKSSSTSKDKFTQIFAKRLKKEIPVAPIAEPVNTMQVNKIPLKLTIRDQISLLTTLDVLAPTYITPITDTVVLYKNERWDKKGEDYVNRSGSRIHWDGKHLTEKSGQQLEWVVSEGLNKPFLQWLIAIFFSLIFALIGLRSLITLWKYQPALETAPEVEKETWDLPLVSAISSLCAACFAPVFYWGMFSNPVGRELSIVFRNQPTPALIGSLLLPLFSLVSGLILSLLLFNDWKSRPWQRFDKIIYVGYLILLVAFLYWLAIWNVLGFRF